MERTVYILIPAIALGVVLWVMSSLNLPVSWSLAWIPSLGIEIRFRIDWLSVLMLLMITGIGTAVFIYTGGYLKGHPYLRRLYVLLTLFMVSMIGCVLSDNLFLLFVFWEATSFLSFLLVGFNHEQAGNRKSAQQALLVTGTGGLVLLAGLILLMQETGTASLSEILYNKAALKQTPVMLTALTLIFAGAFTKSAQFPFHFWLPNAMAAPTPVSAYLHSATMVKLGVYLLARLDPAFGDWTIWEWVLKVIGSITAAWGMILALRERDLKRILAWSTVATLGTLVMLVGLRGEGATVAVGALLLAHALYKAPLFLVAGNVDHCTGTRVIDKLGNLRHTMPWTALAALLAGMSMAGIPLSFGYVVKEVIMQAKTEANVFAFASAANSIFSAIAIAVAGVASIRIFWRHPGTIETPKAHEASATLVIPPLFLACLGIILGMFPFIAHDVIDNAARAMATGGDRILFGPSLESGTILLSLFGTFTIGVAIYLLWDPLHRYLESTALRIGRIGMASQYERSLRSLPRVVSITTQITQSGRIQVYVAIIVVSTTLFIGLSLYSGIGEIRFPEWSTPHISVLGGGLLISIGAVLTMFLADRMVLLLATGLIGYGSAIIFLFTGAPDIAFTQFIVETVFVIVIVSVLMSLKKLGRSESIPEPRMRWGAFTIAAGFGTVIVILMLLSQATEFNSELTTYYSVHSVPFAFGRNVVNVILVDFRAIDTLGEIAVVTFSVLAAFPLLRKVRQVTKKAQKF